MVSVMLEGVPLEETIIDTLLQECRIPKHLLEQPDARIPIHQHVNLMTSLMLATGDELLGKGARPLPVGSLSIYTHWIIAAETLEHAMKRTLKYFEIVQPEMALKTVYDADTVSYEISGIAGSGAGGLYVSEFMLYSMHRLSSWLCKELLPIVAVEFEFPAPSYFEDYRLVYYGAPVFCGCSRTRITFPKEILYKPILQDLDSLNIFLRDPNYELVLQRYTATTWSDKVTHTIRDRLHNLPTLPELADELNVQPHTLQRRLTEEGVSYLTLKNQLKRDLAIELLVNSDLSIGEISERLGFSEISPFTRTFKSWTGTAPRDYRKNEKK